LKGNLFVVNIVAGIVNKNIKKLQNIGKTKKSTQEHWSTRTDWIFRNLEPCHWNKATL